jgi:hypothetical protein
MDEHSVVRNYNKLTQQIKRKCGSRYMWSDVLSECGRQVIGPSFKGCFPKDKMDYSNLRCGQTALVNTKPSTSQGEHWCAVGCDSKNRIVVYDSFGRPGAGLLHIRGAGKQVVDTDLDPEQKEQETNCGPRSLAWCVIFSQDENAAMLI